MVKHQKYSPPLNSKHKQGVGGGSQILQRGCLLGGWVETKSLWEPLGSPYKCVPVTVCPSDKTVLHTSLELGIKCLCLLLKSNRNREKAALFIDWEIFSLNTPVDVIVYQSDLFSLKACVFPYMDKCHQIIVLLFLYSRAFLASR